MNTEHGTETTGWVGRSVFRVQRSVFFRRYAPAVFFLGGFAIDAVTLGRSIKPTDLFILLAYLAAAAAILLLLGRNIEFRGSRYLDAALQFLFGSIFSALFIFYFLSSSSLPGYLVVLGLAGLLVGNEFLQSRYRDLTLTWSFFTLSTIMFFNFALAHLFRSISTFWFYLGTLVALFVVLSLRRMSTGARGSMKPSIAVAALMLLLHAANVIPPVPLVKKEMLIAHDMHKTGGAYVAGVESPRWRRLWRSSSPIFHRQGHERIYCFTSVFVPTGISTSIRHRWEIYDETRGEWVTTSVIPFRITGGRQTGYRGMTWKQNVMPGRWRVIAEAESGATIGILQFRVQSGAAEALKTIRL